MHANRSIVVTVLLTMPAGTLAQEPVAGIPPPSPTEAAVSPRAVTSAGADFAAEGRHRLRFVIPSAALILGGPSVAPLAQGDKPALWEPVDGWPAGEPLSITLKNGELIKGAFKHSSSEELVVTSMTGREHIVSKSEVRQVRGEKKDTTVDGFLLGAAIGAGFGVVFGYDRRTFECRAACSMTIGATLFTPVGAFIGWLRDGKRYQAVVLYDGVTQ